MTPWTSCGASRFPQLRALGIPGGFARGCAPSRSPLPGHRLQRPYANSRGLGLTPNTEITYGTTFLDRRPGPTVIESPPGSLCVVDDIWFRYVSDMGITGPDKAQGGSLQP